MRKKTNEEFLKELKAVWGNEYIPQEEYKGLSKKIKVLHVKCNRVYEAWPQSLLKGNACGYCANRVLKSNSEFLKELKETDTTLIPLGEYRGANKKIEFRCSVCGNIVQRTPSSIINGHKKCGYCSSRLGMEEKIKHFLAVNEKNEYAFIKRGNNPKVKSRDQYIWFQHKKCGTVFCTTWYHFKFEGTRCPHCKQSKGERAIYDLLTNKGISFIPQKKFRNCKNKAELPFDFYLPDFNMCIEFDGEQHFDKNNFYNKDRGFEYRIKNDKIKNDFCKRNKIKLLRIRYDENLKEVIARALKNRSHAIA